MKIMNLAAILAVGALIPTAALATTCPTLTNANSTYVSAGGGCNTVITISPTNTVSVGIVNSNPYDGVEDQYVGVVNNGTQSISSLTLTGGSNSIFEFETTQGYIDGIDTYGIASNSSDTTEYGGPNAFFSGINGAQTMGVVNFLTPIAPGGTGYFSHERSPSGGTFTGQIGGGQVPEPSTLMLLGTGVLGLAARVRRFFV